MVLRPSESFLTEAFTNNSFGDRATDLGLKVGLDNSYSYLYRLQRNLITYEEFFYTTRNQIYNFDYDSEGNKYYYQEVVRNEYGKKVIKRIPIKNPNLGDFYFDDQRRVCINFGIQLIPFEQRSRYRAPDYSKGDYDFYGKEITYEELISNPKIFYRFPVIVFDNKVLRDFSVKIYEDFFTLILTRRVKDDTKVTKTYLGWDFIHKMVGEGMYSVNPFDEENQESVYANHKFYIQILENVQCSNNLDSRKVYKYTNDNGETVSLFIQTEINKDEYMLYSVIKKTYEKGLFTEEQIQRDYPTHVLQTKKELGTFEIKTNRSTLIDGESTTGKISLDYIRQYFGNNAYNLFTENDGCYFATIFIGDRPLSGDDFEKSGTLLDVDVTDTGLVINYDAKTKQAIELSSEDITVRFIFYRYLHKHKGFRGNFVGTHAYEVNLEEQAWSDLFMIQKDELKDYDMAIPKENMILFKVNEEDIGETINETWEAIPNDVLTCFYPNIFQIRNKKEIIVIDNDPNSNRYKYYYTKDGKRYNPYDEYLGNEDITPDEVKELMESSQYITETRYKINNIKPGDIFRAYYFYYPGYDLKFENMYAFFYNYLYCKWGNGSEYKMPIDMILNFILFDDFPDGLVSEFIQPKGEIDPEKVEDTVISQDAVIEFLDGSFDEDIDVTKLSDKFYNFFLSNESTVETIQELQDEGILHFGDDVQFNGAEVMARIVYNFILTFNFVVLHEIVHYHYDDIDYLLNIDNKNKPYAKDMTSLEYRVKRLKEFISDDPEILRKYVLAQNKVSKKYDFYFDHTDREVYEETEGPNPEHILPSYLFTFERFESSSSINYRIFINGFLFVDYIHIVIGLQDYIYIPTKELNDGDFVEIETFPTYSYVQRHTFTKENPSVVIEFPEPADNQAFPTLADLYIKYPFNDNLYYPKENFNFEVICKDYNYYKDENSVPVFYPKKKKEFISGVLIDTSDETRYIPTLVQTLVDGEMVTKQMYAKYIYHDEETGERILSSELDLLILEQKVTLRPDGVSYQLNNSNKAYRKDGVYAKEIITSGFVCYIEKGDLPKNLIHESILSGRKLFVNRTTGDYFIQKNTVDDEYYLHNKFDLFISEKVFTQDEIATDYPMFIYDAVNEFVKIDFGGGFYTSNGNHYSYKGKREPKYDITEIELNELKENNFLFEDSRVLTDDLLLIEHDRNYIGYDKVEDGESVINENNKGTLHTPLTKLKITVTNDEYFNNDDGEFVVDIGIRKDSILEYSTQEYDNYPCYEIGIRNQIIPIEKYVDPEDRTYWKKHTYYNRFYHYNSKGILIDDNYLTIAEMKEKDKLRRIEKGVGYTYINDPGANEFVRVFRQKVGDGARLRSKNRYELLMNEGSLDYGYPRVQMLERVLKGEKIIVDVTPYRNRLVYYQDYLAEPDEYDGKGALLVDLRTYINKPFDIRYYEVYLNGRRIARNNIFPVSPYMIRIAGIHSLHSLEIYEKDRDWEYYGCDYKDYYLLNDLLLENFMENGIKGKLIEKLSGPVPENHICEDDEEYERDLNIESVFLEIFYYNRLLPLGLADADSSYFGYDDIKYNFSIVYELFYRYKSNELPSEYYRIVTSDNFSKLTVQYTDILSDNIHNAIVKREHVGDLDIVIYRGIDGSKTIYDLYTGPDLNNLKKVYRFDDDFLSGNETPRFDIMYSKNLYLITTGNKYGIYYTSENGTLWIRRRAAFSYLIDGEIHELSMSIITPSMLNEEYVFFGACYDENYNFIDYMAISSYDGLSYHWREISIIDSSHINMNSPAYYSPSKGIVIFSSEYYTEDGVQLKNSDLSSVPDIKKNSLVSLTRPEYISESCGILYSGKKSNNDTNFNYTAYSLDGKSWNKIPDGIPYLTTTYGINDAIIAVQLNKGDVGDTYSFVLDTNLNMINDFSVKKDFILTSFDEFVYVKDGVYVRSGKDMYYLSIEKVYIGPSSMNAVPEHVLLLDPDTYYQGDDENRWNVYMTGNSDEFLNEDE